MDPLRMLEPHLVSTLEPVADALERAGCEHLLIVASQRRQEAPPDLGDALTAMEAYAEDDDRRFQEVDYEDWPQLNYELAGAFLLARDLAQLADPRTKQQLQLATVQLLREERMGDHHELGRRFRPLLQAFELGPSSAP